MAGSSFGMALKSAAAPGPALVNADIAARRPYGPPSTVTGVRGFGGGDARERLAQYSQQSQFVAGKTFFQNDKQWVDGAIQKHLDAKHVRIQFGSPEYFALAAKEPRVLSWLAIGQNVQFEWEGKIYEIYE